MNRIGSLWNIQKTLNIAYKIINPIYITIGIPPIEEDYDWRDELPSAECLCEICFDILNTEKKIKWKCA